MVKKALQLSRIAIAKANKLSNTDIQYINGRIDTLNTEFSLLTNRIDELSSQFSLLVNLFGVTFNSDNTINTEDYTTHTHSYNDKTIADTADGSGATTDTLRTTGGVN